MVHDNALVYGNARVFGNGTLVTEVSGDAHIAGDNIVYMRKASTGLHT